MKNQIIPVRESQLAPPSSVVHRLRRLVCSGLAAALVGFGVLAGGAAPANATTAYGVITACFTSTSSYPTYSYGPYGGTTGLQVWLDGRPYDLQGAWSVMPPSGCTSILVPTGYQFRMKVDEVRGGLRFTGYTGYTPRVVAGARYNLSGYVVTLPYRY